MTQTGKVNSNSGFVESISRLPFNIDKLYNLYNTFLSHNDFQTNL
jgi:hypothetical protein